MNLWFSVGGKTNKKNCYGLDLVITNVKFPFVGEREGREKGRKGRREDVVAKGIC